MRDGLMDSGGNGESLSAFIFINFEQAMRCGHCAWGFETEPGRYFFGSTDHLLRRPMWDLIALAKYSAVPAGGDIDYWCGQGSLQEMLSEMSRGQNRIWYHAYKEIVVPASRANPEAALRVARGLRDGGWRVWHNNCVHQTGRVLGAFGADLKLLRTPVRFFAGAPGESRELVSMVTARRVNV